VEGDSELLQCAYCGHRFLDEYRGDAASYAPVGRLGRRRALSVLRRALSQVSVKGHVVEQAQRLHLPFWDVQAKLVGWQRYRRRLPATVNASSGLPEVVEPSQVEMKEETFGRNVSYSTAACDPREYGLTGISGRARFLSLRPFQLDRVPPDETVCAVLKPASVVLRQARLYHAARSVPRDARRPAQRVMLIRPRIRLIYYPVWRLRYRSMGRPFEAIVDGLQPHILKGSYPVVVNDALETWLAAGAAAGLLAGLSTTLGTLGAIGWSANRLLRDGVQGREGEISAWVRRQVGGKRVVVRTLGN